jgi:hypothetical protein
VTPHYTGHTLLAIETFTYGNLQAHHEAGPMKRAENEVKEARLSGLCGAEEGATGADGGHSVFYCTVARKAGKVEKK